MKFGIGSLGIVGGITLPQRIRALFAAGEQGVLYDPADFSTLFQDSAGTTLVTAVGQPVGLVLDKSKGLVRGAQLVANGDFSSGATGWSLTGGWAVSGGVASNPGPTGGIAQTFLTVGKWYEATWIATDTQFITCAFGGTFLGVQNGNAGSGRSRAVGICTSSGTFQLNGGGPYTGIDNISVRELPGNHGKQATSTARPLRQASPTRIDYDAVDDALVSTFATSLGAACTVCRAVPGVGASILTAQTIGTSYTDSTDHSGLIIVNRALTAAETASVTAYLNQKAFA